MDAKVKGILSKTAAYIETTQSAIDRHNENRVLFMKRAHQVAGVLASRGVISRDRIDTFVDKVAEDETGEQVWNLVEKLAAAVSSDTLGEESGEKLAAAGNEYDPFERLALFGDARAEASSSGMIE